MNKITLTREELAKQSYTCTQQNSCADDDLNKVIEALAAILAEITL